MKQNINQVNKWYNNAIIYHLYPLAFVDEKAENNLTHAINRTDKIYNWINHIKDFKLLKQKLEEYILKDYYNPEIHTKEVE